MIKPELVSRFHLRIVKSKKRQTVDARRRRGKRRMGDDDIRLFPPGAREAIGASTPTVGHHLADFVPEMGGAGSNPTASVSGGATVMERPPTVTASPLPCDGIRVA